MKPDFFTSVKGGPLRPWLGPDVTDQQLEARAMTDKAHVLIGRIYVYSLIFPGGRRWTCIDGWNE